MALVESVHRKQNKNDFTKSCCRKGSPSPEYIYCRRDNCYGKTKTELF